MLRRGILAALLVLIARADGAGQSGADISVVGYIKFSNGLGRVTTALIDALSRNCSVNFIDTRPAFSRTKDMPARVKAVLAKRRLASKNVSLLTDNIWLPNARPYTLMPRSSIKLAYSMCESTRAPKPWVDALNSSFDAVIVPDEFLVKVYKDSGVKVPVFVIPIPLYLEDFLKLPLKRAAHTPFVFGVSAALSRNKNIALLIESFTAEFGNRKDVVLKIHSPWQGNNTEIQALIRRLKVTNVHVSIGALSWQQYVSFMASIDCYCLLSLGEGFSITVREAMALGIPCIIANNTAHTTICKTGLVYGVASEIRQKSIGEFHGLPVGDNFNCPSEDVRLALRTVHREYAQHLALADRRRAWVEQYLIDNLAPIYAQLARPSKLYYGAQPHVDRDGLTVSGKLFDKYKELVASV